MADQAMQRNDRRIHQRRQGLHRIENYAARHVTFSKRKTGLFRKASELATLCVSEVGILVNSPAGRPYTFGSPSIEAVFNRFLSNNSDHPNYGFPNPPTSAMANSINQQFMDISSQLRAADLKGALLNDRIKRAAMAAPECNWSEKIDELDFDELTRLFDTLCQTRERLVRRQTQLNQEEGGSSSHADITSVDYPGQARPLIIGNRSLAHSSQIAGYNPVQTNRTNVRSTEPRMSCFLPTSLNTNPAGDMSLDSNFVLSSGGANNAMHPLQGLSFGPFGYNMGNQLNNATCYSSNTKLFFDPTGFGQSKIVSMTNPQMPYNLYSDTFDPNNINPIEGINYGLAPPEPGTLASIPGPYISTPQARFDWGNNYLGQNYVGGFVLDAQNQAGPSNLAINNSTFGTSETNNVDTGEADPETTMFSQGSH